MLHYHEPQEHAHNLKRDVSRPILECTGAYRGWIPGTSLCTGPQTYSTVCHHPTTQPRVFAGFSRGRCEANELCIDGAWDRSAGRDRRAYCVSKTNFVKIAQNALNTERVHIPPPESSTGTVHHVISEAVLTASDGECPLMAKSLTIEALGYDNHNRLPSYKPLTNGTMQCLHCGRVGIDRVPGNASLIRAQVVLEAAGAAGLLFLATTVVG